MTEHRVVVTGMGILAANANSPVAFAEALREGRSGVREITRFDPGFPFRQAGEVAYEGSDPYLDRVSQLVLAAAHQAVTDSGLDADDARRSIGVSVGTSRGSAQSLERLQRPREARERLAIIEEIPFSSIARNVARELGLGGTTSTVTMACVSSSLAIGRAMDAVRRGQASAMLAGGGDALTRLSFSGFSVLRAMTRSVCRPFDRRRDGMVLGEGAGMLMLEEREQAHRRGARIYGELLGWGSAGDAHHPTGPHPEGRGLVRAMELALSGALLPASAVDHINLHGTATRANDPAECAAVRRVFGEGSRGLPVNSLKPMIGHTLGGAGVLELAGSLLGMCGGFIAPTLHHEEPDPECDLAVVHGAAREQRVQVLMSTKSAFGGANVAIVAREV